MVHMSQGKLKTCQVSILHFMFVRRGPEGSLPSSFDVDEDAERHLLVVIGNERD